MGPDRLTVFRTRRAGETLAENGDCHSLAVPAFRFTWLKCYLFSKAFAPFFLPALLALPVGGAEPPHNARVRALIGAAKLKGASAGVCVLEVKSGRVLCSINEALRMTPASNMKLVTAGAALLLLGDKFQFTTSVYAAGKIGKQGALDGDLVVVAGGDPAISGRRHGGKTTAVFDAWAAEIAKSVKSVEGDLVIDDTIFDRQYIHPAWPKDQLIRWYCAPVSAFALNDNCIGVAVKPGTQAGGPARVILDPPTEYFAIRNRCKTIASGRSRAHISRLPKSDTLVISGTLTPKSRGAGSPVTVVEPLLYAATVLRERLSSAGVRVRGKIVLAEKRIDTKQMTRLAGTGHSLADVIRTANKGSQNFYAEMIFKTLGRRLGEPASFAGGARVVTKLLADTLAVQPDAFTIDDGSGLSKQNALSARQLASFLRHLARGEHADTFLRSLAISGVDGTLRRRMTKAPYAGNVLAKTGHVRGVSALSGYVKSGDRLLAFSILVNGKALDAARARRLQDSICRFLVDSMR